ncbi:S-adenosyl-L-methionine-dependent methyltransferases superfamily protein [Salvia divinorum]|uniref:S-adenosyl-L-methionine-dependent methyltransferases superfamily protein n=1 Tax=Salvia divinorum TaxID=28513 RepID=A0ABD1HNV0_SALDI
MSVGGRFCTSISTLMDTCEGGSHSHMEGTVKYSCHFGHEDETLPLLCAPDDDPDKVWIIEDNLRLELQPFVIDVIIVLPQANNL